MVIKKHDDKWSILTDNKGNQYWIDTENLRCYELKNWGDGGKGRNRDVGDYFIVNQGGDIECADKRMLSKRIEEDLIRAFDKIDRISKKLDGMVGENG